MQAEFRVDANAVLQELAAIAFLDPRKLMSWGHRQVQAKTSSGKPIFDAGGAAVMIRVPYVDLVPSDQLDADAVRAIQAVEKRTGADGTELVSIILASKFDALASLATHLGLIGKRIEHSGAIAGRAIEMVIETEKGGQPR